MENELNYLSEKIDLLEGSISQLERLATQQSDYNNLLTQLRQEKEILESILNKLIEFNQKDEYLKLFIEDWNDNQVTWATCIDIKDIYKHTKP